MSPRCPRGPQTRLGARLVRGAVTTETEPRHYMEGLSSVTFVQRPAAPLALCHVDVWLRHGASRVLPCIAPARPRAGSHPVSGGWFCMRAPVSTMGGARGQPAPVRRLPHPLG